MGYSACYFLAKGVIISTCICYRWAVEAFEGSIKAGNDDAVNYLLQNFHMFIDQKLKVRIFLLYNYSITIIDSLYACTHE